MSVEILTAYIITTFIILVIPGPTIILVMSQAVTHGRKSVIPLVMGVVLGDLTCMTMSLLGLGAIMAASSTLFMILKWAGALYLFYLGIKSFISKGSAAEDKRDAKPISKGALFKSSFIVTALNPKGIAFFVAFLPQFISPESSVSLQIMVFCSIFLFLALVNATLYAIFASSLRETIRKKKVKKWFNRLGGSALIGAGILTAGSS